MPGRIDENPGEFILTGALPEHDGAADEIIIHQESVVIAHPHHPPLPLRIGVAGWTAGPRRTQFEITIERALRDRSQAPGVFGVCPPERNDWCHSSNVALAEDTKGVEQRGSMGPGWSSAEAGPLVGCIEWVDEAIYGVLREATADG